jgi:hypothetical protein
VLHWGGLQQGVDVAEISWKQNSKSQVVISTLLKQILGPREMEFNKFYTLYDFHTKQLPFNKIKTMPL